MVKYDRNTFIDKSYYIFGTSKESAFYIPKEHKERKRIGTHVRHRKYLVDYEKNRLCQ